jgi:hypothetical protein
MLVNLINDALISQGWPTEVKTGRNGFDPNGGRNVENLNTPTSSSVASAHDYGA